MQIGAGTNPMSSYVAFTRVTKKEDLLIYRPFARNLFCQGNLEGPELLLKVLRGEDIDWQAIEEKHMPSHMCHGCDTKQFKAEFSPGQWSRLSGKRYCKACEKVVSANRTQKQCHRCGTWKPESSFSPEIWKKRASDLTHCLACGDRRKCRRCNEAKLEQEFTPGEWKEAGWIRKRSTQRGTCKDCIEHGQDLKQCTGRCKNKLPEICFTYQMWNKRNPLYIKCKECQRGKRLQGALMDEKECDACHEFKSRSLFTDSQWERRKGRCMICCKETGQWTCRAPGCTFTGAKDMFREWTKTQKLGRNNGYEWCNKCFLTKKQTGGKPWVCRGYACNFIGDKESFRLWRAKQKQDKANGKEKCDMCFFKSDADIQSEVIRQRDLQHTIMHKEKKPETDA